MNHPTTSDLHDYADHALAPAARAAVEAHLATCAACRAEVDALRILAADLAALPRSMPPPGDFWPEIEARLAAPPRRADRAAQPRQRWITRAAVLGVLALCVTLAAALAWRTLGPQEAGWTVAALDGLPRVGADPLEGEGRLRLGEWLETDGQARAVLEVGLIGRVEVAPQSRVQLRAARPTDHRLRIERGALHAQIWAPPRLFFVETPSALAIDLGCEYTLEVDAAGTSLLHVTAGYVELVHEDRTTIVPAGAMAQARPGQGPGTPYAADAPEPFRRLLARYDFEDPTALPEVLAAARAADALSLWHLLARTHGDAQARIYDRLAALIPPPPGVTREGILRGDAVMLHDWQQHLGFDDLHWLDLW